VISAIGESLSSTSRLAANSSGSSVRTSGWQSSMRNTFRPSSARRAGSRKMTSGRNPSSTSSTFPGSTLQFRNLTFSTPNSLKFRSVAFANPSCISLYNTSSATSANAHESTPIPPVRSAIRSDEGSRRSSERPAEAESAGLIGREPREIIGGRAPSNRWEGSRSDGWGTTLPPKTIRLINNALYRAVPEELHCSPERREG